MVYEHDDECYDMDDLSASTSSSKHRSPAALVFDQKYTLTVY